MSMIDVSNLTFGYEGSPELGGSNEEVYGGMLGLTEKQLEELKNKKVI